MLNKSKLFTYLSIQVLLGFRILDAAFAGRIDEGHFKVLPLELNFNIFVRLLKDDETSLISLTATSKRLREQIQSFGYHPEPMKITSYAQLDRLPPTTHLPNVKFANSRMSKRQINRCLSHKRLKLVEKVDVQSVKTLDDSEKSSIEDLSLVLSGHTQHVSAAALSKDGKIALTASLDGSSKIWNLETGEFVRNLDISDEQAGVLDSLLSVGVLSHDASLAITGSLLGPAKIWNVETGALIHTLPEQSGINSAAFSADGRLAITASKRTAKIWDVQTGDLVLTLEPVSQARIQQVTSVAFSSNGEKAITGSRDGNVSLWNILTGELLLTFEHSCRDGVSSVSFSSDGTQVITASLGRGDTNSLMIWDTETGSLLHKLENGAVDPTSFSPDGMRAITTGSDSDRSAFVWNLKRMHRLFGSKSDDDRPSKRRRMAAELNGGIRKNTLQFLSSYWFD